MQGICDSLVYTGLDSMARFYKEPIMWSDTVHQFAADSMQAVIKNRALSKVNLISNAFIASRQDSVYFNQVKATEMVAYFSNNEIYRFDALGGASALLFMEEDSVVTIMNHKECKMLTARIKDRTIKRTRYINDLKQDAHPIFMVTPEEQTLRGFKWSGDKRPKSRFEVTDRGVKKSNRLELANTEFPDYSYTGKFFPEKKDSIVTYKIYVDSIILAKKIEKEWAQREKREKERMHSVADSLKMPEPIKDSVDKEVIEAVEVSKDSVFVGERGEFALEQKLSKKELRRQKRYLKKQQRLKRKQEKIALREQKKKNRKSRI